MTNKKHTPIVKDTYFSRIEWSALNLFTGLFVILVAWNAL